METQNIPPEPTPRRRRRRRRADPRPVMLAWTAVVLAVVGGWWYWSWLTRPPARHSPLEGYITDVEVLRSEYLKYEGHALADASVEQEFQEAAEHMQLGNYTAAAVVLETVVRKAALPVVYNDLGVVYTRLQDGSRALNSFRDALARDVNYRPVRANLSRLKFNNQADPVTQEVEPNNSLPMANVISLSQRVDGSILAGMGDLDCFRFNSPPAPRDVVAVDLINRSQTLEPRLRIYDGDGRLMDWSKESRTPGASLHELITPPPNTKMTIQVDGLLDTAGDYTILVAPQKAYDRFEPNDLIVNATRIQVGTPVDANVMDSNDSDFYQFQTQTAGTVNVDIKNGGSTLIPGIATFDSDLRTTGFGPDLHDPGIDLHYAMKVDANRTYYVQVWGQANTVGTYKLTVK